MRPVNGSYAEGGKKEKKEREREREREKEIPLKESRIKNHNTPQHS
jgi:hypothetical protein